MKIGQLEEVSVTNDDLEDLNNFRNLAEYEGTYYFIKDVSGDPYVCDVVGLTGSTTQGGNNRSYDLAVGYTFRSAAARSFGDDIYLVAGYYDSGNAKNCWVRFRSMDGGTTWEAPVFQEALTATNMYIIDIFKVGSTVYFIFTATSGASTVVSIYYFVGTGGDSYNFGAVGNNQRFVSGYVDGSTYYFLAHSIPDDNVNISLFTFISDNIAYVESIGITLASITTWNVYHQIYWKQGSTEIFMCEDFLKTRTDNASWKTYDDTGSTTNAVIWYKDSDGNYIINFLGFKDKIFVVYRGGGISPIQNYTGNAYVGYDDWFSNGADKIYQLIPTTTKDTLALDLCNLKFSMFTASFKEFNAKDIWSADQIVFIYDDNDTLLTKQLVVSSNKISRTITLRSPAQVDLNTPIALASATNLDTVLDDNLIYCSSSVTPTISVPACTDKPLRVILRESVINGGYVWYITAELVLTVDDGTELSPIDYKSGVDGVVQWGTASNPDLSDWTEITACDTFEIRSEWLGHKNILYVSDAIGRQGYDFTQISSGTIEFFMGSTNAAQGGFAGLGAIQTPHASVRITSDLFYYYNNGNLVQFASGKVAEDNVLYHIKITYVKSTSLEIWVDGVKEVDIVAGISSSDLNRFLLVVTGNLYIDALGFSWASYSANDNRHIGNFVSRLKPRYLPQTVGAVKVIYQGNNSVTVGRSGVGGVLLVYNFPSIPTSALATTKATQILADTNKTILQITCFCDDKGVFQQGQSIPLLYNPDGDLETALATLATYYIISATYDEELDRARLVLQDARIIPRPRLTPEILDNKIAQIINRLIYATQTIADGDTTPDVSGGSVFKTSANTGATLITDLDNPIVGQVVILIGGSNTNSSTIGDGGVFHLSAAWTASLDDVLGLYVQADNDYIELFRSNN